MGSIQGIAPCLWIEKLNYDRLRRTYSSTESEILVPGVPRTVYLELSWDNTTKYGEELDKKYNGKFGQTEVVDIVAVPYNSDMTGRRAPLSINGGRSGEEYQFEVEVPHHDSKQKAQAKLSVSTASTTPFSFFDIVFYKVFTTYEKDREEEPHRKYTSKFPIASMGFSTTQRFDSDSDGDGIPDYEEVSAGFDPYLPHLELDRLRDFYTTEIKKVMVWLNIQTGGRLTDAAGEGNGRRLHSSELEPVNDIFLNNSPSIPGAIDELNSALGSIEKLNFYGATQHAKKAISALMEVRPTSSQCKNAAKREELNKKRTLISRNVIFGRNRGEVREVKATRRPAPEVKRYIKILEDATEKTIQYLSAGRGPKRGKVTLWQT